MSRQPVVHIPIGYVLEPQGRVPVTFCGIVGPVGQASAPYRHGARACKPCLRERRRYHRWLGQALACPNCGSGVMLQGRCRTCPDPNCGWSSC